MQRLASEELRSIGIPGIRYLDGGSRNGVGTSFAAQKAAAEAAGFDSVVEYQRAIKNGTAKPPGTRNIVVFDPDSTINSVKRDGEEVFKKGLLSK
jgi:hypothetical protein